MLFKSKFYRVTNILKKTKAKGFSEIKIGDELSFEINLIDTRFASNGIYALYIETFHNPTDTHLPTQMWSNSQNEFLRLIKNFKLKEIDLSK